MNSGVKSEETLLSLWSCSPLGRLSHGTIFSFHAPEDRERHDGRKTCFLVDGLPCPFST